MNEYLKKPWDENPPDKYDIESSEFIKNNFHAFEYWRLMLEISHFFIDASRYDPITGKSMNQSLINILDVLNQEHKKIDIIPEDNIYRTCEKCFKALEYIISNPRRKILREHLILPIHKAKEMDTRCMTWLSKQPGRKLREKIGAKQKVMTVKRNSSYDILENRVVVRFIKDFKTFLSNRINWLPSTNQQDIKILKDTLKLLKTLPDSKLSNIERAIEIKPNNVLLSDKKYNRIWRAVHWLRHYDEEIALLWNNGINRFTSLITWRIITELRSFNEIILFDEFCKVEPGFKTKNAGIILYGNIDDSIQRKNLYILGNKIYKLQVGSINSSLMIIIEEFINNKTIKYSSKNRKIINFNFNFDIDFDNKVIFSSNIFENNKKTKTITKKVSLDNIDALISLIINDIKKDFNLTKPIIKKMIKKDVSGNIGANFSLISPGIIYENNIVKLDSYLYSVKLSLGEDFDYLVGKKNRILNPFFGDIISINGFWSEKKQNHREIPEMLYRVLDKIKINSNISSFSNLAIAFPDNMDEFNQIEMRSSISTLFGKISFPWRSVSTLLGWQTLEDFKKSGIREGNAVIVLDTDATELTFSCLIAHYDEKLENYSNSKGIYWERRPLFIEVSGLGELSFIEFQRRYLFLYIKEKFGNLKDKKKIVDFILNTGKCEELILNKKEIYIPINKDETEWIKINYDSNIIKEIVNKWIKFFNDKYRKLSMELKPNKIKASIKVKEIKFVIVGHLLSLNKIKNTIQSKKIISLYRDIDLIAKGAESYLNRFDNGLKTYKDWVPELWLKTQRDKIQLSEGRLVSPGEKISEDIKKVLVLPANQEFIAFPLSRDENSDKDMAFEAILESSHFPLSKPMDIKMKVEYVYGEGAFRLIILPYKIENPPFKELEVKWKRGDEGKKQQAASIKNERPQMPAKINPEPIIDNIVNMIDDFENYFNDEKFLSRVTSIADLKKGMIFKGEIVNIIKNGLFIDNGYGVDSYMYTSETDNYLAGDIIYSEILKIKENEFTTISDFNELKEGYLFTGVVNEVKWNGYMVDIGIYEKGFLYDKGKEYNIVEGDTIWVKIGKINPDGFYFLNLVNKYSVSLINLKSKYIEIELKKILQTSFEKLNKKSINNINNIIVPKLLKNQNTEYLLNYLGDFCPEYIIDNILGDIKSNNGDIQRHAYLQIGYLFASKLKNKKLLKEVMKQVLFLYNDKQNLKSFNRLNRPLGALAMGIWGNEEFIHSLNNLDSNYIHILLGIIEERYKRLPADIKKNKDIMNDKYKIGMLSVPFRNNNELLFGLLMLRGQDNDLFKAGTPRILKIAKKIIEIDRVFMENGHESKSRFNFELSSEDDKERKKDMSKFVYILNSYLTGEDVSSRIKIKDISLDD